MEGKYQNERREASKLARLLAEKIADGDPVYKEVVDALDPFEGYELWNEYFPESLQYVHGGDPIVVTAEGMEEMIDRVHDQCAALIKEAYIVGFTAAIARINIEGTLTHDTKAGSNWLDAHFCYK